MYEVGGGLLGRDEFLEKVQELLDESWLIKDNKRVEYYNVPAGFDIEVSSFYQGEKKSENKRSLMYIWQFGIYNLVTTGRTWREFFAFLRVLSTVLGLSETRRLVVYVHNLPYEFQFIRKWLKWDKVFMLSERKPVYAISGGYEFKCSLKLAGGKSLENVAKDLTKYIVEKKVGQLDYQIIRTPLTPLTSEELEYCENDIRVILCYIQEKIEQDGDITKIPLTNTGYVRNYCRKSCYKRWRQYRSMIEELTVNPDEYSQLKRGFMGGSVHANAHYVNKILEKVGSHDFTSSYPAVLLLEKFPMSRSKTITESMDDKTLMKMLLSYCCLFELELWGVTPKLFQEHPISRSKCYIAENCLVDNGRIVMADHIKITITEQDFFTYIEFYEWEDMAISNFRIYEKNYLPKEFAMAVLGFYEKKTTLKDIEGEELNYMISKNMLNACYGMIVTDPVREELEYSNDMFIRTPKNVAEAIEKYNKNIRRFLYYPWGIWVTAYARANLYSGIIAVGDDYVYSDTDSIKILNPQDHTEYFERYNNQLQSKIEKAAKYFNIPVERFSPVNRNGVPKTIGIWEDEGVYDRFKTLGAKRYLTLKKGRYVLTLAGANKKKAMEHLLSTGTPFESFENDLTIPPDKSGRLTATYIDFETDGEVKDFLGTVYKYRELSSIHMEPSEYNLSMSQEFIDYLRGLIDFGE